MYNDSYSTSKLSFSSRCLPGSEAEQKEKERLAAFRRDKTARLAEEARNKAQTDALWEEKYQEACQANQELHGPPRTRRSFVKPPLIPVEQPLTPVEQPIAPVEEPHSEPPQE